MCTTDRTDPNASGWRLLFEELARTALGPVVDLLDTTGWDISHDGDLARDYERRFRGRDD